MMMKKMNSLIFYFNWKNNTRDVKDYKNSVLNAADSGSVIKSYLI